MGQIVSITVAQFASKLALWIDNAPPLLVGAVMSLPVILSLFSRDGLVFAATVFLAVAAFACLLPGAGVIAACGVFVGAMAVPLWGLRLRKAELRRADLANQISKLDRQVDQFLQALDRRSQAIDRRAESATARAVGADGKPP